MRDHRPVHLDEVWIPRVAAQGWVIRTRDSRIQDQPAEIGAVRAYGARMVALAASGAGAVWAQLELFMAQKAPHRGLHR